MQSYCTGAPDVKDVSTVIPAHPGSGSGAGRGGEDAHSDEPSWVCKRAKFAESDTRYHETTNEPVPGTVLIPLGQQKGG